MLTDEQVERWRTLLAEMNSDSTFIHNRREREKQRRKAVPQMQDLLARYLEGEIDNEKFRGMFQQKNSREWRAFGLNSFSVGMFLNMIVKYIPDADESSQRLRATLPVPADLNEGRKCLQAFMDYLRELLQSGIVSKRKIQPAFAPHFFSAWWHIQDMTQWPIYYLSSRKAMEAEELYSPQVDQPVEDYFVFRESYLSLARTLGLSLWELESLCQWHGKHGAKPVEPSPPNRSSESHPPKEEKTHTHIQWLLACIGQKLGYKVWIAANDRKKTWNGDPLGQFSIHELPHFSGVGPKSRHMIELIDVVWLKGLTKIVAAFEIESTTSIFSGLLRMSDLTVAMDNFMFPLYIAVPEIRVDEVRQQLSRLTFQRLGLHERCRYFTFEKLLSEAKPIMDYATDVTAIDKISQQVDEIDDEGF